jgi:O-methyltransferase
MTPLKRLQSAKRWFMSGRSPANKKQEAMGYMFPAMSSWGTSDGDYLEFGVYRGRAFLAAYKMAVRRKMESMRFFAFDSFQGLPEVGGADADHRHFFKGQYACSIDAFRAILSKAGVDQSRVHLVPGFFDASLTEETRRSLGIKRVAIAWIDCDLYESTVPVLDFLAPLITTGTFLAFDDWHSFGADPYAGQIRAVREWLERNPKITLEHYRDFGHSGRIFLVQKWDKPQQSAAA